MIDYSDTSQILKVDSNSLKLRNEAINKQSMISISKGLKICIGFIFVVIGLLFVDLYFLNVNFDISGLDFSFQSKNAIVNAKVNPVISTYFSTVQVSFLIQYMFVFISHSII